MNNIDLIAREIEIKKNIFFDFGNFYCLKIGSNEIIARNFNYLVEYALEKEDLKVVNTLYKFIDIALQKGFELPENSSDRLKEIDMSLKAWCAI